METYFSLGTYSINGLSISYNATSVLPKEMIVNLPDEAADNNNEKEKEKEPSTNFDNILKGMLKVPKPQ